MNSKVFWSIKIDDRFRVWSGDKASESLTARERQILGIIVSEYPESVGRNFIIQRIWGDEAPRTRSLDVHVSRIRAKIKTVGVLLEQNLGKYYLKQNV
jgi:DNA-binding response OmpR family regulator